MNYFTQLSIDLANQQDYLDRLFSVYPLAPDSIREIDTAIWENVKRDFHAHDNISMFRNLLKLPLFPVKDGYVPFLRKTLRPLNEIRLRCREFVGVFGNWDLTDCLKDAPNPKKRTGRWDLCSGIG